MTATDLQTAVTLASANANSARANLSTVKSSSSSTSTQIAAASAQVTAADAKLAAAEADLKNATLVSPIAGTVATVNVSVGDQVSGGGTSSGGAGGSSGAGSGGSSSAQIVVISTDSWVVATSVTSADLPSIKPGLQVQITPTGSRSRVFGTVSTVGVVATTSGGVASFPVTVAVTGNPTGMYAGSSATVAIVVKEIADALTVPTAAIRTEGGQAVVAKMVNGTATTTPVQLGMVQGTLTQVTSGLAEGDQVVVEGRAGAGTGSGSQSTGTRTRSSGQGGFGGSGGSGGFGQVGGDQAPPGAPAGAPGGGQ